jgi:hypothetical protein
MAVPLLDLSVSCAHTDELEWFYLRVSGSTKYRGTSVQHACAEALKWQSHYWTYLLVTCPREIIHLTQKYLKIRRPDSKVYEVQMMEEICGKNGRRSSPTIGFPVSSERTHSSGETKTKQERPRASSR